MNCTHVFLGQSPKAIEIEAKINKWDLIRLIRFFTAKENKMKWQPTEMEENFYKWCDWQGFNFQNIQTAQTTQQQKTENRIENGGKN